MSTDNSTIPPDATGTGTPKRASRRSPWPTVWVAMPVVESERSLDAGTNGLAVYFALHLIRFRRPSEAKAKFYASAAEISHLCGISARRLRAPLRQLEASGLVKIYRPQGAARLAHEACQYTLIPIFSGDNKVRFGMVKSSAPEGRELGANLSDSSIAPLTGGDIEPAAPSASSASVEAAGRGAETSETSDHAW